MNGWICACMSRRNRTQHANNGWKHAKKQRYCSNVKMGFFKAYATRIAGENKDCQTDNPYPAIPCRSNLSLTSCSPAEPASVSV